MPGGGGEGGVPGDSEKGGYVFSHKKCLSFFIVYLLKRSFFTVSKKLVVKGRILVRFLRKSNITDRVLFRHK